MGGEEKSPLTERLLEPVELDGVQAAARTRAGQDTGMIRSRGPEVSSVHYFRLLILSGSGPPGSWRVAHGKKRALTRPDRCGTYVTRILYFSCQ